MPVVWWGHLEVVKTFTLPSLIKFISTFLHSEVMTPYAAYTLCSQRLVDILFVLRDSGDTKTQFLHALIPSYSEVVRTFFVPRGGLGTKLSFLHAVHAHKL